MPGPADILRELHHLQQHSKDLRTQLDRGPQQVRNYQDKIAKLEQASRDSQELIKKLQVHVRDLEGTLKAKLQSVDKHEMQLNQASSKKEYDALKVEISSDKQECKKIEDGILEAMTEIEARQSRLPEQDKDLQRAKADIHKLIDDVQTKRNALSEDLHALHKKIESVEAGLPDDLKGQYDRLTAARGEDALSSVNNRTCTACYTEITAQNYNDLLQAKFLLCKSCGRMLYLLDKPAD